MNRRILQLFLAGCLAACGGCVHVHQLIKMNHDGSGTLTERIRVLPRAVRLLKGRKTRTGQAEESFGLLSEQSLQKRTKAFGEVTVKSKDSKTLPNGSLELVVVYDFKDVNKVKLWMPPTFKCTNPGRTGKVDLRYNHIVRGHENPPKYYKRNRLSFRFDKCPAQEKYSSPSILQDYRDVTPVLVDMLKDFRIEIQVQAPDDLETFEDKTRMVWQMPIRKNVVTPFRAYGRNLATNPELIRSFITGEVGGIGKHGSVWRSIERGVPNTYSPYGSDRGMRVDFFKSVEVPKPADMK